MKNEIKQLEDSFQEFTQKVGRLQGEFSTLKDQQEKSEVLIEKLKEDEENYAKAVELLSLVQKVTRDKIKDSFELIVTHALNYIYQSDKYSFHLQFEKRGNLHELKFGIKTPDCDEILNPLDTCAGGTLNIMSFAMRIVMMEVTSPKINGFIISDETFAHLSRDNRECACKFLQEVNKKMGRQVIVITQHDEMLEDVDKLIEVK